MIKFRLNQFQMFIARDQFKVTCPLPPGRRGYQGGRRQHKPKVKWTPPFQFYIWPYLVLASAWPTHWLTWSDASHGWGLENPLACLETPLVQSADWLTCTCISHWVRHPFWNRSKWTQSTLSERSSWSFFTFVPWWLARSLFLLVLVFHFAVTHLRISTYFWALPPYSQCTSRYPWTNI